MLIHKYSAHSAEDIHRLTTQSDGLHHYGWLFDGRVAVPILLRKDRDHDENIGIVRKMNADMGEIATNV